MASPPDRLRLLLVDDELELLDALSVVLARRGFEVTACPDGQQALDALASSQFDAVVLDVKMPGIDGLEAMRRMRGTHPTLAVVLLTGHPSDDLEAEGRKHGAAACLMKPVDVVELADVIRRVAPPRAGTGSAT